MCQFVDDHCLLLFLAEWPTTAPLFTMNGIYECSPRYLRWVALHWVLLREQPAEAGLNTMPFGNLEVMAINSHRPTSLWNCGIEGFHRCLRAICRVSSRCAHCLHSLFQDASKAVYLCGPGFRCGLWQGNWHVRGSRNHSI